MTADMTSESFLSISRGREDGKRMAAGKGKEGGMMPDFPKLNLRRSPFLPEKKEELSR